MMKIKNLLTLMLIALIITFAVGCSSSKELTLGKIEGNIYSNDYFGITMNIPNDWEIQSEKYVQELMDVGKEIIADDNKSKEVVLNLAEQNLLNFYMHLNIPLMRFTP